MRSRIWPVVGVSFLVLLLLVPLFAWMVSREAALIDARTREAERAYQLADRAIVQIRGDVYKAALASRDRAKSEDAEVQQQIARISAATQTRLETLATLLDSTQHSQLLALRSGLEEYW